LSYPNDSIQAVLPVELYPAPIPTLNDCGQALIVKSTNSIINAPTKPTVKHLADDSYSMMATNMIKTLIDTVNNPNLSYDLSGYKHIYTRFKVGNFTFLGEHGDLSKRGVDKLSRYSSSLNEQISYVLTGHVHSYKVETENHGRKVFTSGTLNFSNDYSKNLGYYTNGSQMIIIVNKYGAQSINIELEHIK